AGRQFRHLARHGGLLHHGVDAGYGDEALVGRSRPHASAALGNVARRTTWMLLARNGSLNIAERRFAPTSSRQIGCRTSSTARPAGRRRWSRPARVWRRRAGVHLTPTASAPEQRRAWRRLASARPLSVRRRWRGRPRTEQQVWFPPSAWRQ